MMFRAAFALLALAVPALAQHGGAHAGPIGSPGFSRAGGFSSHSAFSPSPGFARPAQQLRYGPMPRAGFRAIAPPNYSSLRAPYNGNRYIGSRLTLARPSLGRSSYDPRAAVPARGFNQDRDRFDARRRQFRSWYVNSYPYWLGYPYLIDPNLYNLGLYDWGDSDDSAYDTSEPGGYGPGQAPGIDTSDQNGPAPLYPPYPAEAANLQPAAVAPSEPTASEQPLTVIFKSGRAPIKVRNYMMTASVLTDLDSEHYEKIPLDQIDLAATRQLNTAAGVNFDLPGRFPN